MSDGKTQVSSGQWRGPEESLCPRMREGSISGRCVNARAKAAAAAGHAEEGTGKREAASNAFAYGEEREAGRGMHALKEGLDQCPALIIATQWRTGHPWNDIAFNFARRQLSASAAAACMVVFAMVPERCKSKRRRSIHTHIIYPSPAESPNLGPLFNTPTSFVHACMDRFSPHLQTDTAVTDVHARDDHRCLSLSPSLLPAPLVCVSL